MDGVMRRRVMVEAEEVSPYPFVSNYPEFNEYGTFFLRCQTTSTSNTNTFVQSASTNYTYCGGGARNLSVRLIISETYIECYQNGSSQRWFRKAFMGFPVKYKRCNGTAGGSPTATFEVTKEA